MSNDKRQILDAPIVEVTLMEDRARVTRRGRAQLQKDLNRFTIVDVAPIICDKTLSSRLPGSAEGTKTVSIRVGRERIVRPEDQPKDIGVLTEQARELRDQIGRHNREHELLTQELRLVHSHRNQTLGDFATDVSWGQAKPDAWADAVDQLAARDKDLRQKLIDNEEQMKDLTERYGDVEARINAAKSPRTTKKAWLEVDLWSPVDGECDVQIEYVVPNACWRPYHTAQSRSGTDGAQGTLRFQSDGCVWQNTGEIWRGVKLHFSTQRPSLGAEPPLLRDDSLRTEPKSEAIVVEQREQEIRTAGLGAGEDLPKKKTADELPGIDDGGQALLMSAPAPSDVPSDGRPHRVPIFDFETAAPAEFVCMPEKAQAVFLRTEQTNKDSRPILAGPVDLIRDHGLVGRTSVLYVAPGEKFELGWGPEHALRVNREYHEKEPKDSILNALKSWTAREHRVVIRLSNLGGQPYRLKVQERIPVSEIEKVVIEPDVKRTTNQAKPDANGIVTWNRELPARGQAELTLRFILKKDKQVVET